MKEHCPYCTGVGYFQLVTGGSETCPSCSGTGKFEQERGQEDAQLENSR